MNLLDEFGDPKCQKTWAVVQIFLLPEGDATQPAYKSVPGYPIILPILSP
jgi:hypothetical protein